MRSPVLTAAETEAFMNEVFPQQRGVFQIQEVASMTARIRQKVEFKHLRPGGTVSGPTMFTIADCAFYAACIAMVGREAQMVTSNMNITFLRRPPEADLSADARILKFGLSLISGDVLIYSDGVEQPVAHAALTYAMPRKA